MASNGSIVSSGYCSGKGPITNKLASEALDHTLIRPKSQPVGRKCMLLCGDFKILLASYPFRVALYRGNVVDSYLS